MIKKIPPNRVQWKGITKLVAPYGKSESYWNKKELTQIVIELGFPLPYETYSRKELANMILCSFVTVSSTFQERKKQEPDSKWYDWIETKQLDLIPWQPLGQNPIYQSWFSNFIQSGVDFTEWMIGVITEQLPSPLYDFQENDDEDAGDNPDNGWWGSPAHAFLIQINQTRHFITLDSQTIDELGNWCSNVGPPPSSYRSYLHGLMLKTESKLFVEQMNARGFFAWWTGTMPTKRIANSVSDSSLRPKSVDFFENSFIYHSNLRQDILQHYHYVSVLDSVNYRPAEDELFPTILCVLNQNCNDV